MKSFKIITGERGEGKTTYVLSHFSSTQGFVSIHRGEEYYLRNLESGAEALLLTREPLFSSTWKGWYINQEAFEEANETLFSYKEGVVLLDEVGMMEVEGMGFAPFLNEAINSEIDLVITVRDKFIEKVRERFFPSLTPTLISTGRFS